MPRLYLAKAIIDEIYSRDLLTNVQQVGAYLMDGKRKLISVFFFNFLLLLRLLRRFPSDWHFIFFHFLY